MEIERYKKLSQNDGNCHNCHGKLIYSNDGVHLNRGAWEVAHSKPKSKGGTDNLNNLFPDHISCNREKGL